MRDGGLGDASIRPLGISGLDPKPCARTRLRWRGWGLSMFCYLEGLGNAAMYLIGELEHLKTAQGITQRSRLVKEIV